MAQKHEVKPGESLSSIAHQYGFADWHTIYNHESNNEFRKLRANPNSIYAGDEVVIPDKDPKKKKHAAPTEQTHKFVGKVRRGVSNLKWEPAEGKSGDPKTAELHGETNVPDGTELHFSCKVTKQPEGTQKPTLPSPSATVKDGKFTCTWHIPDKIDPFEMETSTSDKKLACNVAHFQIHDTRCLVEAVELLGKRKPNDKHVIQVVSTPEIVLSTFKIKDLDKFNEVLDRRDKAGSFDEFVKKYKEDEDKKPKAEKKGMEAKWKKSAALYAGGEAEVEGKLKFSQPKCEKKHHFKLAGDEPKELKAPKDKAKLTYQGGGVFSDADPTLYKLEGKGCEGTQKALTVEVYPSGQFIASIGLEGKKEILEHMVEKANKLFKFAGAEAEFAIGGSVGVFFGWREEKKEWRAYYAQEISAKGYLKAGFTVKFSAGEMFLHIPSSLLNYIGDIGATAGLEGSITVKGSLERKTYAKTAGGQHEHALGTKLKAEVSVGFSLGVYAKIGASSIFGAEATGTVAPEVKFEAEPEFEEHKCVAKFEGKLEACNLVLKVTTVALITKSEKEWKIPLWEEQPFWKPAKEWVLYDHGTEGHAE